MAAPSALTMYNSTKAWLLDGTIDLDNDTIKALLVTSGYTPDVAAHSVLADITNEVANGNGYATGGVVLAGCTISQVAGVAAFKSTSNPAWTASGSTFSGYRAIFYKLGTANGHVNPLIGHLLLDSAPAAVTFAVGVQTSLVMPAAGWFTLT